MGWRSRRQPCCVPARLGAPRIRAAPVRLSTGLGGSVPPSPARLLSPWLGGEAELRSPRSGSFSRLPSYPRGAPPSSPAQPHRRVLLRPVPAAAASPPMMIPAPTPAQQLLIEWHWQRSPAGPQPGEQSERHKGKMCRQQYIRWTVSPSWSLLGVFHSKGWRGIPSH
ncbi:selenoprotein V-like isoform X3 [Rhineura floridana]|uniref:selenoprotein V-like isoform X3 n=1 Tax=Rhineura floridana TaxID=261503 RepID=UPI002AC88C87|nr:selenoprotein V-like isoform X3 [Rhineura floridana]